MDLNFYFLIFAPGCLTFPQTKLAPMGAPRNAPGRGGQFRPKQPARAGSFPGPKPVRGLPAPHVLLRHLAIRLCSLSAGSPPRPRKGGIFPPARPFTYRPVAIIAAPVSSALNRLKMHGTGSKLRLHLLLSPSLPTGLQAPLGSRLSQQAASVMSESRLIEIISGNKNENGLNCAVLSRRST